MRLEKFIYFSLAVITGIALCLFAFVGLVGLLYFSNSNLDLNQIGLISAIGILALFYCLAYCLKKAILLNWK